MTPSTNPGRLAKRIANKVLLFNISLRPPRKSPGLFKCVWCFLCCFFLALKVQLFLPNAQHYYPYSSPCWHLGCELPVSDSLLIMQRGASTARASSDYREQAAARWQARGEARTIREVTSEGISQLFLHRYASGDRKVTQKARSFLQGAGHLSQSFQNKPFIIRGCNLIIWKR